MSHVTCHLSCVTFHISGIAYHVSCVTCCMSPVTCHMSLTSTSTAMKTPAANSPIMHSRQVCEDSKNQKNQIYFFIKLLQNCFWSSSKPILAKRCLTRGDNIHRYTHTHGHFNLLNELTQGDDSLKINNKKNSKKEENLSPVTNTNSHIPSPC